MGGNDIDRWQDWLHGRDFAPLAPRGDEPTRGAEANSDAATENLDMAA